MRARTCIKASTGPRLFGRGDPSGITTLRGAMLCFNGAAAFWPRRSTSASFGGCRDPASTGPRLFGRGDNWICMRCHQTAMTLQRGRGFLAAEITSSARTMKSASSCFNGAAAFWPRRSSETEPKSRLENGFNGAAAFWPRRSCPEAGTLTLCDAASTGPRLFGRGDNPRPQGVGGRC